MSTVNKNSDMEVGESELDILSMLIGDDEEKWRNTRGQLDLVNQCIQKGETPKEILKNHFKVNINHLSEDSLEHWSIILHIIMEGSQRKRIESINNFKQARDLIRDSKNIVVLTGAGISVPCGVPDFRSRNGIYARLAVDFPDLDEPQSMFDYSYFSKNPKPFFKFAKEIYPGKFTPSLGHKFIKLLEDKNKLLRNYSQNIDTLEQVAGIKNIIHCHGSFATATCMRCKYKVDGKAIEEDVMNQRIPICPSCTNENESSYEKFSSNENSLETDIEIESKIPIMKPDVVFFGEGLPKDFHSTLAEDKEKVDLLIVIGSSLKVRPVAHIPSCFPANIPQILINKESLPSHEFDVELLGDCDNIVSVLCEQLQWDEFPIVKDDSLGFAERSIFDMKSDIQALSFNDSEISTDLQELSQDNDDVQVLRLLNVADLLQPDLTCIRVPPNKYIFKGAEYSINADDVENPNSSFLPITDQYDSSSSDEDGGEKIYSDSEPEMDGPSAEDGNTSCSRLECDAPDSLPQLPPQDQLSEQNSHTNGLEVELQNPCKRLRLDGSKDSEL